MFSVSAIDYMGANYKILVGSGVAVRGAYEIRELNCQPNWLNICKLNIKVLMLNSKKTESGKF